MASGVISQAAPLANIYTTVYTVPNGVTATLNVNIVNRGIDAALVRLAIATATGTPSDSEFIEYDAGILSNDVLERTALVVTANKNLVVYADTADTSVSIYGFEE
jgi:hypothetical protein